MLIEGKNLFPLTNVRERYVGYYMDSFHYVYSTHKNKGKLTKLVGSITNSGHYYTLAGIIVRADDLAKSARSHARWDVETRDDSGADDILAKIRARSQASKVASVPPPVNTLDRSYAVSMDLAVKGRAVLIVSVDGDKLVFGTSPKLH